MKVGKKKKSFLFVDFSAVLMSYFGSQSSPLGTLELA